MIQKYETLDALGISARERSRHLGGLDLDRVSTFESLDHPIDIRVSDLEHMVPWLLCKLHGVDPHEVLAPPPLTESSSRVGSLLHTADMLFSLIVHNVQPEYVRNVAPTLKGLERQMITYALSAVRTLQSPRVEDRLKKGWGAYMEMYLESPRQLHTLFEFRASEQSGEVNVDSEFQAGFSLANAWTSQTDIGSSQWEYSPKHLTVREVSVMIPTKIGLRIKTRLDSVALNRQGGVEEIQVTDLKTGRTRDKGQVARQIAEYQGRLMELAGMVLLPKLGRAPGLESMVRGWPIGVKLKTEKLNSVRFGWRRFDQDTEDMETTWLDNEKENRQEFYKWLKWFSIMMHRHYHEYQLWHKTHG